MSLAKRRALYISFILAFFIITPLVIGYAAGYKFRLDGFKVGIDLEKTGMLVLDTKPQGAKIYIDGRPQQQFLQKLISGKTGYITTPAKIKGLLPGEYDVKMELDGYWSWEKKLRVDAGASTYAEDVVLFRNDQPLRLAAGGIEKISLSPDKNHLAAIGKTAVEVFDLTNGDKSLFKAPGSDARWSPDSDRLLIGGRVYPMDAPAAPADLTPYFGKERVSFKWAADDSDDLYFFDPEKNTIGSFNLNSKKMASLLVDKNKIDDYLVKGKNLFYLEKNKDEAVLKVMSLATGENIGSLKVPPFPEYAFINPDDGYINLYDKTRQILYLIDPFSPVPLQETINDIKDTSWVSGSKLLYTNDSEIWIEDMSNKEKTILTRLGSPIEKAIWHPSNNYVVFSTDKAIDIIELDDREKRSITEIFKSDGISSPVLNSKGDALYFLRRAGNDEGLYKLNIR